MPTQTVAARFGARLLLFCALALAALLAQLPAVGPAMAQEPILKGTVRTDPAGYARGSNGVVTLELDIAQGYHINAKQPKDPSIIPTVIAFKGGPGLTFGDPQYPKAAEHKVDFYPDPLLVYGGKMIVTVQVTVAADAAPGPHQAKALVSYQGCNDQMCLMPEELELPFQLTVK